MGEISRRVFAGMGAGWIGAAAARSQQGVAGRRPDFGDNTAMTPGKWMGAWMNEKRAEVRGGLYLGRFADPVYFLTKPILWKPNPGQERYREVSAPVGFVSDLASIPRVFYSLLRPDGEYAYAAILHDYLYWFQTRSREESDMILKLAMQDFEISAVTIETIYGAVRAAGELSWSENSRLREAGEKRILKRFPDDPRTTWADWKKLPDTL